MTGWDIDWLQCLLTAYDAEHNWDEDEDPESTHDMLGSCIMILAELRADHPKCTGCYNADAQPGKDVCEECERVAGQKKSDPDPTIPF